MSICGLRHPEHGLDPQAPFTVLSVMCFPREANRQARDRMLATVRAGTDKPLTAGLEESDFLLEVRRHASRASLAGSLLFQHHEQGVPLSLHAAAPPLYATCGFRPVSMALSDSRARGSKKPATY